MLLIVVAFLGGVLTVLSPCVLPVLPVLLSGTVGGRGRPLGIITGFTASFVLLTLFFASVVSALNLSPDAVRWAAVALLLGFGVTLAVPALHTRFELMASRVLPQRRGPDGAGFLGGVLVGVTLGVIWTPCVGPILASVTTLALSGQVTAFAALVTLAYTLGVALPMLGVMWGGRRLLHRPALLGRLNTVQQAFGVILVLFAIGMVYGADRRFETYLVESVPALQNLTFLEQTAAVQTELDRQAK
ncbi:cytochrome c biogenesis protein CcdA [Deinococcus metalli]|uniref:Cytochrome C biogenesis protein CcdA n=1 Tax=Deinococcus metalli TaxID=1141878 RepID=A0A7W8NQW5_9DEIO|nr:cytochrome c biogenesis CcdA family protein [Deinococcus metalli]MBB5376278.1 cytochrome c biogenesis protein CcdA [Deinococcus metalli]GHF39512.1 cytochrome C biogenesis protein CcdA [Deinococcus metalli]